MKVLVLPEEQSRVPQWVTRSPPASEAMTGSPSAPIVSAFSAPTTPVVSTPPIL